MKSSFELAIERLSKSAPTQKLTEEQKKEIAELDSLYSSKIAQREIFLKGEISKAAEQGDYETLAAMEKQLTSERRGLQADLEEKKELIRNPRKD